MSTLAKKMRFDPAQRNAILEAPGHYAAVLGVEGQPDLFVDRLEGPYDWIQIFVLHAAELRQKAPLAARALDPKGILWISFPKKSSKIKTDLSRDHGWDIIEATGMRFLNLISIDDTWSGFAVALGEEKEVEKREKKSEARLEMLAEYIDHKTRVILLPPDLQTALDGHAEEKARFEALSFTNRKEYVEWVISAKRPETRSTRVAKTVEYLREGRKNPAGRT